MFKLKKLKLKGKAIERALRFKLEKLKLKHKSPEEVFHSIIKTKAWGDRESICGSGSTSEQTTAIRKGIPKIIEYFIVSSLLDIPCGDFHWMNMVDLKGVQYIGADIVSGLIELNSKYISDNINFIRLDIIKDPLPKVDLILTRDCFVHFSLNDIFRALRNIYCSNSKYLLTTTFTKTNRNIDIATGQWRALNFLMAPFYFPDPLWIINENHPKEEYSDKSLALWKIDDIRVAVRAL